MSKALVCALSAQLYMKLNWLTKVFIKLFPEEVHKWVELDTFVIQLGSVKTREGTSLSWLWFQTPWSFHHLLH